MSTEIISFLLLAIIGQLAQGFPQSAGGGATRFEECRKSRSGWVSGQNAAQMSECLRDLISASYSKVRTNRGLPPLGMPSLEPLFVDSASVRDSSVFTGTVRNLKVYGFSDAFLKENVEVIPPRDGSGRTVIRMRAPRGLRLNGDFDAVANILKSVLPFYSGPPSRVQGIFEGTIDNPVLTVNAVYVNDPQKGARLDGVQLSLNFARSNVKLRNGELVSGTILSLLNNLLADPDMSGTVIREVIPEVLKRFQLPVYNLLDRGLDASNEILE